MANEDYDEAKRVKASIDRLKVGRGSGEGGWGRRGHRQAQGRPGRGPGGEGARADNNNKLIIEGLSLQRGLIMHSCLIVNVCYKASHSKWPNGTSVNVYYNSTRLVTPKSIHASIDKQGTSHMKGKSGSTHSHNKVNRGMLFGVSGRLFRYYYCY